MSREIRGAAPSGTLYARLISPTGLWWNGVSFEAYVAGNYSSYAIAMTEQGNSGFYVADFPTTVTTSGTYGYFVHRQTGGSPAEGDLIINTGSVDWTGSSAITSTVPGAMTGLEWRNYVLRLGFKRTDKDAELYEATTDAIQDMRRRFMFDEAEVEATSTDTISVAGDFKISLESDFGLLVGIILEDGTSGSQLMQLSKPHFDSLYHGINAGNDTGYPRHFCIYGGSIYIGPIPDRTSYVYRLSYSTRAGTITSSTVGVPFTNAYRDVLADNVLARLYKGLEEFDRAGAYEQAFERGFLYASRRERANSGVSMFNVQAID